MNSFKNENAANDENVSDIKKQDPLPDIELSEIKQNTESSINMMSQLTQELANAKRIQAFQKLIYFNEKQRDLLKLELESLGSDDERIKFAKTLSIDVWKCTQEQSVKLFQVLVATLKTEKGLTASLEEAKVRNLKYKTPIHEYFTQKRLKEISGDKPMLLSRSKTLGALYHTVINGSIAANNNHEILREHSFNAHGKVDAHLEKLKKNIHGSSRKLGLKL